MQTNVMNPCLTLDVQVHIYQLLQKQGYRGLQTTTHLVKNALHISLNSKYIGNVKCQNGLVLFW